MDDITPPPGYRRQPVVPIRRPLNATPTLTRANYGLRPEQPPQPTTPVTQSPPQPVASQPVQPSVILPQPSPQVITQQPPVVQPTPIPAPRERPAAKKRRVPIRLVSGGLLIVAAVGIWFSSGYPFSAIVTTGAVVPGSELKNAIQFTGTDGQIHRFPLSNANQTAGTAVKVVYRKGSPTTSAQPWNRVIRIRILAISILAIGIGLVGSRLIKRPRARRTKVIASTAKAL